MEKINGRYMYRATALYDYGSGVEKWVDHYMTSFDNDEAMNEAVKDIAKNYLNTLGFYGLKIEFMFFDSEGKLEYIPVYEI